MAHLSMQNMKRTFRHRSGNGVPVENVPTDEAEIDDGSNNNESGPSVEGREGRRGDAPR